MPSGLQPYPPRPEGDPKLRAELAKPTPAKLEDFLDYIRHSPACATKEAARASGLTRGQIHELLASDPAFNEDYQHARGRNVEEVESTLFEIATDKDHPAVERAAGRILGAYRPQYANKAQLKVGGTVRVEHSGTDVATLREILAEAGALEEDEVVEDAEVVEALPGPADLLPARPAQERAAGRVSPPS